MSIGLAVALRTQRVLLPSGIGLDVVVQGRRDGSPIVLLHGFSDSWRSFAPILPLLPPDLRVIAPSQRGHGDSDRPTSGYTVADYAADAIALMDALHIETALVVGHSMGSLVAQRLAIDHPDRVQGLVLIGAFIGLTDKPAADELGQAIEQLEDPVDPAFVREFQSSGIAQPIPDALYETIIAESLKLPARVWRDTIRSLLRTDLASEVAQIAAPTALLWGDRDVFCRREEQDALVRGISQARLITYPGGGHSPHWECPEQIAAEIAVRAAPTKR